MKKNIDCILALEIGSPTFSKHDTPYFLKEDRTILGLGRTYLFVISRKEKAILETLTYTYDGKRNSAYIYFIQCKYDK